MVHKVHQQVLIFNNCIQFNNKNGSSVARKLSVATEAKINE